MLHLCENKMFCRWKMASKILLKSYCTRSCVVFLFSFVLLVPIVSGCKKEGNYSNDEAIKQAISYYKAKEYKKSFRIFSKLAVMGDPKAQGILGGQYADGLGVAKDPEKAVYWLEKSALNGETTSMVLLGGMYIAGVGVNRDCKKAVYWHKKGAEKRDSYAIYSISTLYKAGLCVEKSTVRSNEYI